MTRPAKKPSPRSHRREGSRLLTLWVTDEEREIMRTRAEAEGRPLSQWIRWVCLREAKSER